LFAEVKRLYGLRSKAVHGSRIKGDSDAGVDASAQLLLRLLRQCVANNGLPCIDALVP
jgi:hypothetical protein